MKYNCVIYLFIIIVFSIIMGNNSVSFKGKVLNIENKFNTNSKLITVTNMPSCYKKLYLLGDDKNYEKNLNLLQINVVYNFECEVYGDGKTLYLKNVNKDKQFVIKSSILSFIDLSSDYKCINYRYQIVFKKNYDKKIIVSTKVKEELEIDVNYEFTFEKYHVGDFYILLGYDKIGYDEYDDSYYDIDGLKNSNGYIRI